MTDEFYDETITKLAENMGKTLNTLIKQSLQQPTSYRKVRRTKYLRIPWLFIEKHYDTDYEYVSGEFEGILIGIRWKETRIPIGIETVEEPVYEELQPRTVTFSRYTPLDDKKPGD